MIVTEDVIRKAAAKAGCVPVKLLHGKGCDYWFLLLGGNRPIFHGFQGQHWLNTGSWGDLGKVWTAIGAVQTSGPKFGAMASAHMIDDLDVPALAERLVELMERHAGEPSQELTPQIANELRRFFAGR